MTSNDAILSNVVNFTVIDYALLVIILSMSIGIGIYFAFFSKNLKTTDDYLVGGHRMKPLPIAISLVARCVFGGFIFLENIERKLNLQNFQPIVSTLDCGHTG